MDTNQIENAMPFFHKCVEKLKLTGLTNSHFDAVFCSICGKAKDEFQVPEGFKYFKEGQYKTAVKNDRVFVLDCRCERDFKALVDWYKLQIEIYGVDYESWRLTGKGNKKEYHFRNMEKVKAEIDRVNAVTKSN